MANTTNLRILVIDDEVTQRMIAKDFLEEAGHVVRQSHDGKHGLKMAITTKPDIILLDLLLPSMDGYELCRTLKDNPETKDIPVVLITAAREADVIEKGLAAGADDFVTKPVDWAFLSDRAINVVKQCRERAELTRLIETKSDEETSGVTSQSRSGERHDGHSALTSEALNEAVLAERSRLESEFEAYHNGALQEAHRVHASELAALKSSFTEEMRHAILAERSRHEADHRGAVNGALQQEVARHYKTVEALKAEHAEQLRSLDEQHSFKMDSVRAAAQNDLLATERRHSTQLQSLRTEFKNSQRGMEETIASARSVAAASVVPRTQASWALSLAWLNAQFDLTSEIIGLAQAAAATDASVAMSEIEQNAKALHRNLSKLKVIAQAMSGQDVPEKTQVDVAALLQDVAQQAGSMAKERRVLLKCEAVDPNLTIATDGLRLRYVLLNILANAVRFTPANGEVTVSASLNADNQVHLSVQDTGVGIAPARLKELQDCLDTPISSAVSAAQQPLGLGIPGAVALMRQLGGKFELSSRLGQGTLATLVLSAPSAGGAFTHHMRQRQAI